MRVPFKWLRQLVDLPDNPFEVAEKLRYLGVPVEEVKEEGIQGDHILIGEIIKVEKHPNADKLLVTEWPTVSTKGTCRPTITLITFCSVTGSPVEEPNFFK
jgi:predicted RNA-binding protein with EMAP domain